MADREIEDIRLRRAPAWTDKTVWNGIYEDAWTYVVPYRKPVDGPSGSDKGASRLENLYDNTAIVSTFRGAGQMQQDLYPSGQPFFRLKPGPISKAVLKRRGGMGDNGGPSLEGAANPLADMERRLDDVTEQIRPFFLTGDWDNASSELCIDLYVGTGIMLLIAGDLERPIRFVTLPVDECALEPGPHGDVAGLFWKTKMARRAIAASFPKGVFPDDFHKALKDPASASETVTLYQDFVQEKKGKYRWKMVVSIDESEVPIAVQRYRTQPFIAARYFRVPGETHGRGPALLAIPTARTLNRAMELALKNFALNMLGIWGYRPGGTFNPDGVQKGPGSFWPMQATGGVMGPDVFRIDTGGGRADLSQIVIQELRTQLQAALHDEQLPTTGTPSSAAEVMARMSRIKANYVGAFGRMINEVIPVVVRRAIEILHGLDLVTVDLALEQLLVSIEVISPLAQALKADVHRSTVEAMQMVAMLEGPQAVARRFKLDEILPEMIKDLGVGSEYVRTVQELAAYDAQAAEQAQAAALAQSAIDQPKAWSDAVQTMTQPADQGAAA